MKEDSITMAAEGREDSLEELKQVSSDDALLMAMGKKPELRRVYNFWTCMLPGFLMRLVSLARELQRLDVLTFRPRSVCLPDHDFLQLVLLGCPLFYHLRHWRSVFGRMGNVSLSS